MEINGATNFQDALMYAFAAFEETETKVSEAEELQRIYEDTPLWRVFKIRSLRRELDRTIKEARELQTQSAAAIDYVYGQT